MNDKTKDASDKAILDQTLMAIVEEANTRLEW